MATRRNPSYVYGQDSIFDVPEDNYNDGVDSMLSRDQRRSTNHYYGQPPQRRGPPPHSKYQNHNFYTPKNNNNNKYPILEQSNFHNQNITEADYLDQMVHSVEQRRGRYSSGDYDEEKQHSQLHSSFDNDDDDDDDDDDDSGKYYLATANAARMRTVDEQSNTLATSNSGSGNVLAYILGGFGLCPPDEHGMKADAQVSHFQTNGGGNTAATNDNNNGGFNICAPETKELATDSQVQRFAATTEPQEPAVVPGGVEVKRPLPTPQSKKTPLQQFRERKLKLRQKHQLQEEKKETDLRETAAYPFNTRQFSDVNKQQQKQQDQHIGRHMEQGDVDLEEQLQNQLKLQEEEEELLQQLEKERQQEQLEKDKKMDAAVDSGMDLCAIPGCPTGSASPKRPPGNLTMPPNPSEGEFPDDPFDDGNRDNNLLDDGEEQSRLERIRQKKRNIEYQLETDYSPQNRVQVDTKYATSLQQNKTAPMSLTNKAIVSVLVIVFVGAAALVAVSFFWPNLMPKLGRGTT